MNVLKFVICIQALADPLFCSSETSEKLRATEKNSLVYRIIFCLARSQVRSKYEKDGEKVDSEIFTDFHILTSAGNEKSFLCVWAPGCRLNGWTILFTFDIQQYIRPRSLACKSSQGHFRWALKHKMIFSKSCL
jgi:hypothetical protein